MANQQVTLFKSLVNSEAAQAQLKNALGNNANQFAASLIEVYSGDAQLQTCSPGLVVAECIKAATLHLPINKALGQAYVVVYNQSKKDENGRWTKIPTPTFIIGYKGLIQMAIRTGQYRYLNAGCYYEGECVRENRISGMMELDSTHRKSDKVAGYFAYLQLLNGFEKMFYVTVEEIAAHAKRYSPSVPKDMTVEQLIALANTPADPTKKTAPGWTGNFNAMAKKTCLRQLLSVYGYLSTEMLMAFKYEDEAVRENVSRDSEVSANANQSEVTEEVPYEQVDEQTGEVQDKQEATVPAGSAGGPQSEHSEQPQSYGF